MKFRRGIVAAVFFAMVVIFVMVVTFLTGCQAVETTEALIWNIKTGDKLTMDVSNEAGYTMTDKTPFQIKKGDQILSEGSFLDVQTYEKYLESVKKDVLSKIEEEGNRDGMTFTLFTYAEKEYKYLIMIDGSKTAIILENTISLESAKEAFSTFKASVYTETKKEE